MIWTIAAAVIGGFVGSTVGVWSFPYLARAIHRPKKTKCEICNQDASGRFVMIEFSDGLMTPRGIDLCAEHLQERLKMQQEAE